VDPVSKILIDRERARPRLLPWVVLAVVLHAGAAAATYVVGRRAASRPAQLPVVSVKIVRPRAPSRRPSSRRASSRPTAVPQPSKPPPTAAPKPTAAPPPADAVQASADAMRSEDSRSTPVPTPPPAEPGGRGRGLSVGSSTGGDTAGIPADFHFTYYVERMLALSESRWYKPAAAPGTRARVGFVIMKDGRVQGIRLEESSGLPSFDRAALRALYAANPLPPLPPAYGKPSLTVHLSFTE